MKLLITISLLILAVGLQAQQNIADVRQLNDGQTVTVTGIVTNGSELGKIRYIQDQTAGLGVYDDELAAVKRGDSITVTGITDQFRNLFEITGVTQLVIHSSGHPLPDPKIISVNQIGEKYEGQLVRINGVEFNNAGGTFTGNDNYTITAEGGTAEVRIGSGSPIAGENIPSGPIDLVAICSQFSYSTNDTVSGYQLLPRDMNDFISDSEIEITTPVTISNISRNGFTLAWETDREVNASVWYGLQPSPDSLKWQVAGTSAETGEGYRHEVNIGGLEPATIIYARAYAIQGNDTTFSSLGTYVTESSSTGEIKVYFNSPVKTEVATGAFAIDIGDAIEDTLISYIEGAKSTIDLCIYNINNNGIANVSEALNDAYSRGVKVRVITSGTTAHLGIADLNSNIPVLVSPDESGAGLMHNKFALFDVLSSDQSVPWIWTGSTNLTEQQIEVDANHVVFIQDKSLALAYLIEFEEMWGGSGDQPVPSKSRFGSSKTDNTPHEFVVGGNRIQCYFSPSDRTTQKIIQSISSAGNDVNIETMLITREDIALSIKDAKERGVHVHVMTDNSGDNAKEVNDILNQILAQGEFVYDQTGGGKLHHKVAIIDANDPTSDPQVILGSHNWSNSAEQRNDENTLIIHNAGIANQFFQQFAYRFEENGGTLFVSSWNSANKKAYIYPNPARSAIHIRSNSTVSHVKLMAANGYILNDFNKNTESLTIDVNHLNAGMYLLEVTFVNGNRNVYKVIKL